MTVATNVLIWWISAADIGSIGDLLPHSFPDYIRREYAHVCHGARPYCGRLYVAPTVAGLIQTEEVGCGVVVLAEDASFLSTMPGIITRPDLSRWDGDTATTPRAERNDVVGLEAAAEEALRGLTRAAEVAPIPPILPGDSDLCSRTAGLIRTLLSTVRSLKVRATEAEVEVERLRGLIATAAKAGASSIRKDHSAALLPLIREVERHIGSVNSLRSAPPASESAADRSPSAVPPTLTELVALAKATLAVVDARGVTPGPWRWWTSNSFRRLSSDPSGKDGDVASAYVSRHDGQPDIEIREEDMAVVVQGRSALAPLAKGVLMLAEAIRLRSLVDARSGP